MKDFNIYLTQENLEEIERELEYLERVVRPKAIEEVTIARGHGDLSENFEFVAAREELRRINQKIAELKRVLVYAKTVTEIATDSVEIGSRFVATSIRNGVVETKLFELVGYADLNKLLDSAADSTKSVPVTINSPFGKAIHGKKEGEIYEYIDAEHNRVTGEVVSIVAELEVEKATDKVYTI